MDYTFIIISLIKIAIVLGVLFTCLAYIVWVERKVAAHIQGRWGPRRTGAYGLLQPLADLLKFIFKEDTAPSQIEGPIYYIAPILSMSLALMSIAVIPFGTEITVFGHRTLLQITNVNVGILYIFAVTSLGVYGIALAGWSSGSKYSLIGGIRSSAQMISYELSLGFAIVGTLILAGSLNLREIVQHQAGYWLGFIPRWHVFPQLIGFGVYLIAAFAETNRLPFDLPEAEGELVAGFHTEYSSLKFAMFFTAEYANMVTVACIATLLFFGGWLRPLPWAWMRYVPMALLLIGAALILVTAVRGYKRAEKIVMPVLAAVATLLAIGFLNDTYASVAEPIFWFAAKIFAFLFLYIWVRWSLPRFRYDQLMNIGWKLLLPVAALNILVTSLIVALRS